MLSNYVDQLIFDKTFSFSDDSVMMLEKIPFTMFPAKAMATFIQETAEEIGSDELNDIAFEAGIMVAEEFIEKLEWSKVPRLLRMKGILKMLKVMGFGECQLKKWDVTNNKAQVQVTKHPVIEYAKELYGADEKICGFYMAIYSSHFHKELEVDNCRFKETKCSSRGDDCCEWSYNM